MEQIKSVNDIKSGYLVEMRNGFKYMCLRYNQDNFKKCFIRKNERYDSIANYDSDLKNIYRSEFDIMKIYGLDINPYKALSFDTRTRPLLWQRNESKEMTLDEIEKELGYKVKIIGGKQ